MQRYADRHSFATAPNHLRARWKLTMVEEARQSHSKGSTLPATHREVAARINYAYDFPKDQWASADTEPRRE